MAASWTRGVLDPGDPGANPSRDVGSRAAESGVGSSGHDEVALSAGRLVVAVPLGDLPEGAPDPEIEERDQDHEKDQTDHERRSVPVPRGEVEVAPDAGKGRAVRGEDLGLDEEEPARRPGEDRVVDEAIHRGGEQHLPEPLPPAHPERLRRLPQFEGERLQRLVDPEDHVPGHRGEDQEDGRDVRAQPAARSESREGHDRDREESEDGDRLEDVEHRDHDLLARLARGGVVPVGEGESERGGVRRAHPEEGVQQVDRRGRQVAGYRARRDPERGRRDATRHERKEQVDEGGPPGTARPG